MEPNQLSFDIAMETIQQLKKDSPKNGRKQLQMIQPTRTSTPIIQTTYTTQQQPKKLNQKNGQNT